MTGDRLVESEHRRQRKKPLSSRLRWALGLTGTLLIVLGLGEAYLQYITGNLVAGKAILRLLTTLLGVGLLIRSLVWTRVDLGQIDSSATGKQSESGSGETLTGNAPAAGLLRRFRVIGINHKTGEKMTLEVSAHDEDEATDIADDNGMAAAHVSHIDEPTVG